MDDEMHSARVLHCPHHEDTFPRTRMMRVMDQDIELLFLGSMSWGRPAWANQPWPARWAIKPVVMGSPRFTVEHRACSPSSPPHGERDGWRA
jgi:hypothetical protein